MKENLEKLRSRLARMMDLNAAASALEWDQETYMPPGAAAVRALQIATLRKLAHEHLTDETIGTLLDRLAPEVAGLDPASTAAALVRETRRDYERARKLPSRLVSALAEASANAREAWKTARENDSFDTFAPHLERLVALNLEKAETLGYEEHVYDPLLDEFEPGMRAAEVEQVFEGLRAKLVPLVHAIAERPAPDETVLHRPFDPQKQWDFGIAVIRNFGFDFERGRQDFSTHPFTSSFSIFDVRLTTRVDEHFFNPGFFGTLHEAGHGLYEQGIDPALDRTPLASGTSLGMHESQSRLWENLVGRSLPFWKHYYPHLQKTFPESLDDVDLDTFYRAVNKVAPTFIRVEADEVTYNLHIMLRFELEKEMLEGRLSIADLPEAWNAKMAAYLGLEPETDTEGVLQDIHWSLGAFGYFPTYALGNLMSAQLFDQAKIDLPDLEMKIGEGDFEALLGWLRKHIHRFGRKKTATAILKDTTGEGLQSESWLAYIREKYGRLYDL